MRAFAVVVPPARRFVPVLLLALGLTALAGVVQASPRGVLGELFTADG
jgi:hypothetical protein